MRAFAFASAASLAFAAAPAAEAAPARVASLNLCTDELLLLLAAPGQIASSLPAGAVARSCASGRRIARPARGRPSAWARRMTPASTSTSEVM